MTRFRPSRNGAAHGRTAFDLRFKEARIYGVSKKSSFIPADLLYEAIVDSSDDAIVSKNVHSIVMSWNKAAERMFGYTAEEMIGQSIEKLFPPDRLDEETQILARLQKGERVEHFETKRQRKDGKLIDVSLTISPIRNVEGVLWVHRRLRAILPTKKQRNGDWPKRLKHSAVPIKSKRNF